MPRPATERLDNHDVQTVYRFDENSQPNDWEVEDDVVMGGVSSGNFELVQPEEPDESPNGRFYGHVSLENNGGFSSIQRRLPEPVSFPGKVAFSIRFRGDGKRYNWRVKPVGERYSYTFEFLTAGHGEWETTTIPFDAMKAQFRGEPVDVPNYSGGEIEMIRFLIGNKKEEDFELLIDEIEVM